MVELGHMEGPLELGDLPTSIADQHFYPFQFPIPCTSQFPSLPSSFLRTPDMLHSCPAPSSISHT